MPIVNNACEKTDEKTTSNAAIIRHDDFEDVNNATKEQQINELKDALHDALDILEGKKPRKTISDILNG